MKNPIQGVISILSLSWPFPLWRVTITDVDNDDSRIFSHPGAKPIFTRQSSKKETTTMEVDQDWQLIARIVRWLVYTNRNFLVVCGWKREILSADVD